MIQTPASPPFISQRSDRQDIPEITVQSSRIRSVLPKTNALRTPYEIEFISNSSFSVGSIPRRFREDGFGFANNQDFPDQSARRACGNQSGDEKPPTPEFLSAPMPTMDMSARKTIPWIWPKVCTNPSSLAKDATRSTMSRIKSDRAIHRTIINQRSTC